MKNTKMDTLHLEFIIGWTGHERSSQVFTFDLNQKTWKILVEDKNRLHRCDPPVGLSGHTATAINSGLIW